MCMLSVVLVEGAGSGAGSEGMYDRLYANTLKNNNRHFQPSNNGHAPAKIKVDFALYRIVDLEETLLSLRSVVWIRLEWTDKRLGWKPAEYNNVTSYHASRDMWRPDLTLYDDIRVHVRPWKDFDVRISHDGQVKWQSLVSYTTYCDLDVIFFPLDRQRCRFKFGSWAYDAHQLEIVNASGAGITSEFASSSEWDLIEIPVVANLVKYEWCNETYSDVTFTVVLQRRGVSYLLNLLLPVCSMVVLSTSSFYLSVESGEKATLAIGVFLTYMVYNVAVTQLLPTQSKGVPIIVQCNIMAQLLLTLSTLLNVSVVHIHFRGNFGFPVSPRLRRLMFRRVAHCIDLSRTVAKFKKRELRVERNRALLLKGVVVIQTAVRVSTAGDLAERLRPAGTTVEDDTTGSEYLRTQQNILTQLKRLAMYRTGEAQSQTLGLQWALLAMICDRMFFYVLLMVGTIGVGTIVLRFILMV
ncbi:Acetylcholine receptor subunit alpha-like [Lamellibrachia satsuma]|nr:Acetylcholine receptor subunit alpha-like [Lamellibrachia satsuma]